MSESKYRHFDCEYFFNNAIRFSENIIEVGVFLRDPRLLQVSAPTYV